MLLMSLVAFAALVLIILLSLSFAAKAAARRAEANREVSERIALIQKKAHETDQNLAAAILAGTGIDPSIAEFQKDRSALLPAGRSEDPWAWTAEDLAAYRAAELKRRSEEVGRRLLVPAVASILVVVLATAGTLALLYQFAGPRQDANTAESSTPPLSVGPGMSHSGPTPQAEPPPAVPTDPSI